MSAKIVIQRNIFESKKETVYIQEGKTVEECLKLCKVEAEHCVVSIDGKTCDKKKKIESGDIVIVKVIPGDLPVDAWMMVAGTALVMTALVSAAFTGGLSLTLLGLGAGLFITGYGIDNGWFVPSFDLPKTSSQERPTGADQIRGTRNKLQQGAPVPIVLGKHYIAPPMIAPPSIKAGKNYAWGKGNIIRELFTVGYGALRISDVRIGETQIFTGGWSMTYGCPRVLNYYENIGIELRYDQERMSIYPYQESTEFVNVEISHAEGGIVRSSEPSTDRVFIDLLFPTGLVRFNSDGKKKSRTVDLQIYCKPYGSPDGSYTLIGSKSVSGSKAEGLRIGLEYAMSTRGQWTFKVVRVTEDSDDTKIYDKVYFEAITSQQADDNVSTNAKSKIVRMALSVGAEGDWQGIVDTLSCIAESIVPVYSGVGSGPGSWKSSAVSSNPAALFLWLLRGAANSSPVENAKIDWGKIEEWYTWCAGKGYECNGVITSAMTLLEALRVVATTGRASPLMIDGKYSVVIDKEQDEIVQQFTQRNVSGFKAVRAFRDVPHAIKCDFVNAAIGYQVDQRIVYRDGYSLANATKFETISFKFITSNDQVYRFARYRFAEAILRPEVFTFETDWEHIVCTRGDRVKLTHDVILVGLCAGRVKELIEEEDLIVGFTGDEQMPMEAGKNYAVRFRTVDGTIYKTVETVAGEYNTITFSTPLAAGSISVGDLYSFGEAGLETIDCLVAAISPKADMKAEVSLVEYNEAIYTADTEEIPEWESKITIPSEAVYRVASPIIIGIRSDGTVLQLQADGSFIARILVAVRDGGGAIPAEKFELRYKIKDTDHEYTTVEAPGSDVEIWISPVEELFDYEIGVRSIGTNGTFSDWVTNYHTVAGKTAPPQDISSVVATVRGIEGVEIRWAAVTDVDLDHYELRVGADWETGEELFNGLALSYLWNKQTAGTYRLMVKAADRFGNKSAVATYTDITIDAPGLVQNLTSQVVENSVLVAWAAPATGSLPIGEYRIYKGALYSEADLIGEITGTFFTIVEADLDTYNYWVVAVDVAGNVGTESDVEASIVTLSVPGTTGAPSVPTVVAFSYAASIAVYADKQANLAGQYFFHIQVSADEVDWYEPNNDGTDWKTGEVDGYGTIPSELFYHTDIPYGGTEAEPTGVTLYYRMRRVKYADPLVMSDWSTSASATTRGLSTKDYAAKSITADKLFVGLLNALIAQINDNLVVSADYGWLAGAYTSPVEGNLRAYLDTDELKFQIYTSGAWADRILIGKSGDDWLAKIMTRLEVPQIGVSADTDLLQLTSGKLKINGIGEVPITGAGNWYYTPPWDAEGVINSASSGDSSLVLLPDSRVLCVYKRESDGYLVQKIRDTNGTWGTESVVNSAAIYDPNLVLLPDSRVLCVYRRVSDGHIVQRIRNTDCIWGAESTVNNVNSAFPSLVLLPDGKVLCVYQGTSNYLVQKIRDTNGTWGAESVVNSAPSLYPSLVLLPDKKVLCVYQKDNYYLVQRIRATDGTWGAESEVNNANSYFPSLVLFPDGRVLCVYKTTYLVQKIRATDGTWGAESVVNSALSLYPSLVLLPDGKVLCVYRRNSDGYLVQRADSSYYKPVPIGSFPVQLGAGIIEVGENSNGTWIKFSDGTVWIYRTVTGTTTYISNSSIGTYGWSIGYVHVGPYNYPIDLIAVPTILTTASQRSGDSETPEYASPISVTQSSYRVAIRDNYTGTVIRAEIFIVGRWK